MIRDLLSAIDGDDFSTAGRLITPMIISKDEQDNIGRVLERLNWAQRVLLIDSGSTDHTLSIAKRFANVEILYRAFDSFARQCNFGLSNISTPWVLSLDADYVLSTEFVASLKSFSPSSDTWGYRIPLRYCVSGRPLRGTLLPPRVCLYRRSEACYEDDGHSHHLRLAGPVLPYPAVILHDDRKPLSRWLDAQRRYQAKDAEMLLSQPVASLKRFDRLRRTTLLMPLLALPYCLIIKQGVFDGWRGWFYAFQRVYAELQLALMIMEANHSGREAFKTRSSR
jgi:glycosyltransferase involved in cell wall biosynthesis